MALDGTYAGLKASVARFLNRSDLTDDIPDFITLAEAQMHRRFVGRQREGKPFPRRLVKRADASISLAAEYIAVPSDFAGPLKFELNADPIIDLRYLDGTNLQAKKAENRWTGAPKWYAVVGGELQLYPIADQTYTGELTYISRVAAASDATPNWILTDYPDAYLYGALVQSAPYLKDDGRLTTWGALFTAAVDDICSADPMPSDESTLRSETALLSGTRRRGFYDINSDC